jgi:hypothetical protein
MLRRLNGRTTSRREGTTTMISHVLSLSSLHCISFPVVACCRVGCCSKRLTLLCDAFDASSQHTFLRIVILHNTRTHHVSNSGKMIFQFLLSRLAAAPLTVCEYSIAIKNELISASYVALTIGLMNKFAVASNREGDVDGSTPSFVPYPRIEYSNHQQPFRWREMLVPSVTLWRALSLPSEPIQSALQSFQGDVAFANGKVTT